ncbi:unnamed protein product, partial [Linum tenue]
HSDSSASIGRRSPVILISDCCVIQELGRSTILVVVFCFSDRWPARQGFFIQTLLDLSLLFLKMDNEPHAFNGDDVPVFCNEGN